MDLSQKERVETYLTDSRKLYPHFCRCLKVLADCEATFPVAVAYVDLMLFNEQFSNQTMELTLADLKNDEERRVVLEEYYRSEIFPIQKAELGKLNRDSIFPDE